MKKENCPFCGHRWVRSSSQSQVICPCCKSKYIPEEIFNENNIIEEEEDH